MTAASADYLGNSTSFSDALSLTSKSAPELHDWNRFLR